MDLNRIGDGQANVSQIWPADLSKNGSNFKYANGLNTKSNKPSTLTTNSFTSAVSDLAFRLPSNIDLSQSVIIECIGAGGSSYSDDSGTGGGGGGAYSKKTLTNLSLSDILYITVGGPVAENNGEDSKVVKNGTNLVLAKGGDGVTGGNGASGGLASSGVGDVRFGGGAGSDAVGASGGAGGSSGSASGSNNASGGTGGAALGIGGAGGNAGQNGSSPGGGSGGSDEYIPAKLGGTGLVKFTYYLF